MRTLFFKFIQEKRYLDNTSLSTVRSYNLAFDWLEKLGGQFNREALDNFVVGIRQAGMSPGGCNVEIRSINSFLSWCYRKGHSPELKIKTFRVKDTVPYQLNDSHIFNSWSVNLGSWSFLDFFILEDKYSFRFLFN